jgi:uncharacterized protein YjbJ (UPF0337 family)
VRAAEDKVTAHLAALEFYQLAIPPPAPPEGSFDKAEAARRAALFSGKFSKQKRREQMKPSTKDQIKGNLHEMKGKVKEKAGQVTNNPNLAAEGQAEKLAGKVQKKVGQIEKVFEK